MHNYDALGLQVIVQRLGAVLAAKPASLDSPEGQLVVTVMQRVHPHVPGLETVHSRLDVLKGLAPDRRAEAIDRLVGSLDRLFHAANTKDRQKRPEGLFSSRASIIGHAFDHSRQIIKALLEFFPLRTRSAQQHLAAAVYRVLDLLFDFFALRRSVKRAHPNVGLFGPG